MNSQEIQQIKESICDIGRRIYMNHFVAANDGNISVKVSDNEFYCTPTGVSKGFMTPDMIIKVDSEGNKIEGNLNPSSEIKMHLRVYKERPDVKSVVHAHPPVATAFAVALLQDSGTLVTPGACFGEEGCLRIGYACDSDTLRQGLAGISRLLHTDSADK